MMGKSRIVFRIDRRILKSSKLLPTNVIAAAIATNDCQKVIGVNELMIPPSTAPGISDTAAILAMRPRRIIRRRTPFAPREATVSNTPTK